jgi:hypothetical protein
MLGGFSQSASKSERIQERTAAYTVSGLELTTEKILSKTIALVEFTDLSIH